MILLWGLPGDTPIARVQQWLTRRGHATTFLDERDALDTDVRLSAADASDGVVRTKHFVVDLSKVTAVYQRPYGIDRVPALAGRPRGDSAWQHAQAVAESLTAWMESTPALVVNPASAMASNGSKPYQAQVIAACGLRVPETLVTTDPDAVHEFRARHGGLIYKSTSGVRSIVARLSADKLERLSLVRWCPTQFQEYVDGDDYRVHVVGDEVFACVIASNADDYRYASRQGDTVTLRAFDPPDDLAETCRRLSRTLGLVVAGIDLRRHPDRGWYCFEVNPSPAFTYFEDETGHEIGEAVARLLAGAGDPAHVGMTVD
jgi:glutathione synthase/RimK-type ligase-like ATP-grasp enzyme